VQVHKYAQSYGLARLTDRRIHHQRSQMQGIRQFSVGSRQN
jgi:hypothetical protein